MWREYGYDRATCFDCEQCVGTLQKDGSRVGAIPGMWEARGRCRDPFPTDGKRWVRGRNGAPGHWEIPLLAGFIRDGQAFVRGSVVLNDPRFAEVEWNRCPVAMVGHRNCPAPDVAEDWIGRVFDAANWTADGAPLRDLVDQPTDALREGVLVVRREASKMHEKQRKVGG